jgi:hypothetical protein
MKYRTLVPLVLSMITLNGTCAIAAETPVAGKGELSPRYLAVNIDRVEINTEGLTIASAKLAESVNRLARAIEQLSTGSASLNAEEKQVLLAAVSSVDEASQALAELARQLPRTAQNLTDQLPRVISDARQPIAELSSGLESARDGIFAITESLPQATENAKQLVNASLDSALIRFSTYTLILIGLLALALIGVMWFVYRQYLDPLARKLDALTGAPEHFADMSRYMKETSDNLLALQSAPGAEKLDAAELPASLEEQDPGALAPTGPGPGKDQA